MKTESRQLIHALVRQVSDAVPKGKSELSVKTYITRPMWEMWCEATDIPLNAKPSAWNGLERTFRVYGSETVIVESPHYLSWSEPIL